MTTSYVIEEPGLTAPAGLGTVVQRINAGQKYALAFGGQGGDWLTPAAELLVDFDLGADLRKVAQHAVDTLEPLSTEFVTAGEFDLVGWIDRGHAPRSAAASVPGILITQLGALRALGLQGIDVVAHPPGAVVSHSQGVLAAHVVRGLRAADALAYARIIGIAGDRVARETGLVGTESAPVMLAVSGAPVDYVLELIEQHPRLVARVRNGVRSVVVSGPADEIAGFRRTCAKVTDDERAEVDAKRRGGVVFDPVLEPVPSDIAFHHPELEPAVELAAEWAEKAGLDPDRARGLAADVLVTDVDWPGDVDQAIGTGAQWILDLGPSDLAARMTRIVAAGRGVGVIATGTSRGHRELTVAGAAPEVDPAWSTFAPTLVHLPDGRTVVETAFTRLTGKSPILLAGMTPTTVDASIVAAAANAGFWAELAGGGQVTEEIFWDRVAELDTLMEPGRGYSFNSLLLDPYLWKLQLGGRKLVQKARAAGAPIEAVVVTAGIPEVDEAVALIDELHEAGITHVAFKPGTVAQIKQVIAIADAVPQTSVIVHVEGGKAGGHHSWEDLDELLIATYGQLRRRSNVVLCVGGGIGTPDRAADYLLGRWSQTYGYSAMPVDGILVGTAAMAAREATTAPEVKQALADAPGTPAWVGAGTAGGGIASSRSQLGADIHEIDNAASRTGRLLDEVAGDADAVAERRDEIIEALDGTAKKYFGDLETMTYGSLLDRYLELSYRPWGEWLDVTWSDRFLDLLHRAEARLHAADRGDIDSLFASGEEVADAEAALSLLSAAYPQSADTILHPSDRAFFVQTCRTAGKPVNFVPVLDADVRRWWRSDSLWQAHDRVYSADEVCIIPGPESVAGIERVDEPIAELLGRFEDATVDALETIGHSPVRVASRLRAEGYSGAVARALASADARWNDRTVVNPVLRLGPVSEWSASGGEAVHAPTEATLNAESADVAVLRVPVGGDEPLTLRMEFSGDGAQPLVVDPAAALQTLLAVAAGGELPEVSGGVARLTVDASRGRLLEHGAVTSAGLSADLRPAPHVPDALVGLAWPAVFAIVGQAETADGTAVAEGMLDLVHLDHTARLSDDVEIGAELHVEARLVGVEDGDVGRVVTVEVAFSQGSDEIALFTERLAIRGRRGEATTSAPPVAGGIEPTEVTRRTRRTTSVTVPSSMDAFAVVSGDHNPLHSNLAAARLAGLEAPIAHGMYVSAAAQHAVTAGDADTPAKRITGWTARYLGMVAPGGMLDITIQRIGFSAGSEVVEVTCKVDGELVMIATARLAAPSTVYAFPGQGIQHVGMGMDGYGRSAAAREVWDRADAHTREVLGFSILHVVRDNPTTIVAKGVRHHHPDGVLFLTQFTQVAMATLGAAQTAELREADVFVDDAYLCGHSVGEYNALAAISGVLTLEAVVEIVFQRGSVMHTLVPRDSAGRSDYRLAAIRPSQLGLADDEVTGFVDGVAESSGEFLQIVNFNLRGSQYAIAGTVKGLEVLEAAVEERRAAHNGRASFILVPGIDVPFHSRVLHPGVPEFRDTLTDLLPAEIDPSILEGRYIPNLVPRLFTLDRSFVAEIADLVPSEPLNAVLEDFDAWAAKPGALCRVVLVELLAWQFASPVRWIETQDLLFGGARIERFIEVGVGGAPTVANLASSTLKIPGLFDHAPEVVNVERDAPVLFGTDTDPVVEEEPEDEAPESESDAPAQAPAASAAAPAAAADAPRPDDLSFGAADATKALLALATKMRPEQIAAHDSIESLCDGVSSRRNQILLDLGTELGLGAIDGAAEADLTTLSSTVEGLARGYRPFGPVLTDALGDLTRKALGPSGKKPSAIADRVTGAWQLGDGWAKQVAVAFALGTRDGASVRGGDLGTLDVSDVDAAIDTAVGLVADAHGVSVALPAAGGGSDATIDAAALGEFTDHITGRDGVLASAARLVLEQLGHAEPASVDDAAADTELADLVSTELGTDWQRTVTGSFDADRAVLLDDRWASAREDLASLWLDREVGSFVGAGETIATQADWWADKATADGRKALARTYRKVAKEARSDKPGAWADDVAVVTGASAGSIAASVVAGLLAGGAGVIATTSRLDSDRLAFFKKLYRENAASGAWLRVVPANMASFADIDALASWIGEEQSVNQGGTPQVVKPALRPTLLFPFAAPRVMGDLADAGSRSETDMRVLLWSVERLIGQLAALDAQSDLDGRLHIVLPGSPNRGMFGGDGAYGESKAALDAVVAKWSAEKSWAERVTMVHAIIGWVRGTGLMGANDPLVEAVEEAGVRTWSPGEMAAELLGASTAKGRKAAAQAPVTLDLTAGLAGADLDLAALAREAVDAQDEDAGVRESDGTTYIKALPASPAFVDTVETPDWGEVPAKPEDLVAIVGVGELGPYGSARTRFEAEVDGELSAAGILELAWTTGLVTWEQNPTPGWYDTDSGDHVAEEDLADRYGDVVAERVGVRSYVDDGSMTDHTAPLLASVYLDRDMTFSVGSESEARAFASADPSNTVIAETDGEWTVTRKAGTEVRVPRKLEISRTVGGQIPTGFDPSVWGLSADMIESLDRVALWNLVCTVDAFLSAGFTPAELLRWVHPARVANTQGTGMGGMQSMHSLYIDTMLGEPKPNDLLQEALPNVIAAHVAQSYVGGYGAMIHPVAACATTAVSVEEGVDKIALGKADVVVAGGFDDLSVEGIVGFADMSATADTEAMRAKGIDDRYLSRANDRRRGGFVESQGGGTVLLVRGDVAVRAGLPVLGVVAYAGSFGDGIHTSIPAPGLGALSAGIGGVESPLARGLASVGLTTDDISIVSKHDTSTQANDPNESELHERLQAALGRTEGNPLFVISQKTLTGHAKGGAAAFQLAGLTQVLASGVIPPNRSLDCVDDVLAENPHLVWLRESLPIGPAKAGLVTSLGFGHVSGLIALAHPQALVAAIPDGERDDYLARAQEREIAGRLRLAEAMCGGPALYDRTSGRRLGDSGVREREAAVLLDPSSRMDDDGVLRPGGCT